MTDVPIILDRAAPTPLSRQVADQLRGAAAQGIVSAGDRLPSTRELAAGLGVSRTVTAAAYEQLYSEGWIVARHGSGTFVATAPSSAIPPSLRESSTLESPPGSPPTGNLPPESRAPRSGPVPARGAPDRSGEPDVDIDLGPGVPWVAGLPAHVWRRAWRRAADAPPDRHPRRAGLLAYRSVVEEHLLRHRGLAVEGSTVLATSGTTAAVGELATTVLRPGDTVAVEEPGYARVVAAFRVAGLNVRPMPVDRDGLVVEALPEGVQAVYCTPAHQYPLGARLPANRRVALVEWARQRGVWIIEDDYDGELRHDVAPLPVLASVGSDVVVHLGTTSKIVSPTLGVGWMVAPPAVADAILERRLMAGASPAPAGQQVLVALAESGDLARHLRRVRRELTARRELVVRMLEESGHKVMGDRAGAHVAVPLGDVELESRIVDVARENGVGIDSLSRCCSDSPEVAGVTLGYGGPAERAELERGVRALLAAVQAGLGSDSPRLLHGDGGDR
ncbi:PLP-dependent aminotransferase family protein [Phytoactinopolyspora halophila]|nr:PLP-dependent aminotransferase family protein [Phytoactinopolyspora halophila]